MDKTEKLKHIILSKYNSIREFSKIVEIPSTTLTSALDKGIGGMAVDRIIKICDVLNIDIKTFEPLEIIPPNNNLSQEETTLLENYNKSNDEGKKMILSHSDYVSKNYKDNTINEITATKENNNKIVELPKREKQLWEEPDKEHLMPIACHDDNLTDEEKNIMNERINEYIKKQQ